MAPAFRRILSLVAMLIALASAAAASGLDQARIRSDYRDGEFEKVIGELQGFLKSGRPCSRSDSVFLAKHLGVVYAAHPDTRELGRHHMFRLLRMSPDADLLDMFVGQEVDGVFEKVRKENALNLAEAAKHPPAASAAPSAAPSAREGIASGEAWRDPGVWIGGGAALAVVAFTLFYSGSKQAPEATTYVVPADAR